MNRRNRNAFTLVEMLVVIAIIAMLTSLLVPAVQMAREAGRRATCINNQHEISLAITQYDAAKTHLPGYANPVGASGNILSWVPVIFPYLGRTDLWEGGSGVPGWRTGAGPTVHIAQLICPDDPAISINATTAALTYIANLGLYQDQSSKNITTPGMFRNYTGSPPTDPYVSISDVKTPSRTLMIAEGLDSTRLWNTIDHLPALTGASKTGFAWPDPTFTGPPDLSTALVGSNTAAGVKAPLLPLPPLTLCHPGIVIVTFCDGHVEALADSTPCNRLIDPYLTAVP